VKQWLFISTLFALVLLGAATLDSCRKTPVAPAPSPINFVIPTGFPAPVYKDPMTEQGFLLGRKLFYDGRLSIDGNFPCSSCHQPDAAFTTFEHDRSHGYNHSHTLRNSPGLFNLAWYTVFNQDGSGTTLEQLYTKHITDPHEMATNLNDVISRIKRDTTYARMFYEAYGDSHITTYRIFNALTQFIMNLVSANSKYDKVKRNETTFSPQEASGYSLFQSNCATCHREPLFTDFQYHNTGLEVDPLLNDYGRMRVTGHAADSLKFRTPSLRNLELTSYYGHDGRYNLARTMVRHYENGINQSATLDPLLASGIPLSPSEEDDILFFLRTLTDSTFLNNPRFRE